MKKCDDKHCGHYMKDGCSTNCVPPWDAVLLEQSPQAGSEAGSAGFALLDSLAIGHEHYKKVCATDNPDHWSRGYNNGCLDTIKSVMAKLKQAI